MPALNYQKQFAPDVEAGVKRQSIRAKRKRPFVTGDKLYHYTGMRTKSCRKLGEAIALEVSEIKINGFVKINGRMLPWLEIEALAEADGFNSVTDFMDFFRHTHGFPFEGQLIKW